MNNTYVAETEWLDHFGFERSPFERLEAGSEEYADPGFLARCFVDPDCLLDILGKANSPVTQILYAKRGEGKTACRVMVDYLCQHEGVPDKKTGQPAYVLSIPHIHFDTIVDNPTLEKHIKEIMMRSMCNFSDLLLNAEKIRLNLSNTNPTCIDISWYLNYYGQYLTQLQIEFLTQIGFTFRGKSARLSERKSVSSIEHLRQWCRLMYDIGVKAVYVLVDGLDEIPLTAANIREAYRLFAPLITNRELLDKVPYFALKCFLPSEMESLVLTDRAGRPELIPSQKVLWSSEKLKELLRQRIFYFRNPEYQQTESGFEEFCVPELYGVVETRLIRAAESNPRNLLKLCDLMVKVHCRSSQAFDQDNKFRLTQADLQTAIEDFESWYNSRSDNHLSKMSLDVRKIIDLGETERIEFKSSLIRDLASNQPNDALVMKIGKEIAGMLNSNGGVLLIGVGDDKTILGIEGDFEFLGQRNKNRQNSKKQDVDGFRLKLVDLIKDNLGSQTLGLVKFHFETVHDKMICMVIVEPSPKPVFFSKTEEFFIRSDTSNIRLSPREFIDYVHVHWSK